MASGSVRGFEPSMEARLKRALGRLGRRELQRLLRSLYGKQEETKPPTKKQLLTTFLSAYAKVSQSAIAQEVVSHCEMTASYQQTGFQGLQNIAGAHNVEVWLSTINND